jgi:RNA polymerase sigma-70 factor (ECF subfamily)
MDHSLETMWDSHRDYLRRVLIGLSKEIDLAEDLLQETYLNARSGFDGFRGGDGRAWLAAIARNAFNSHIRQTYLKREIPLETDLSADNGFADSSVILDLRRAISKLSPTFRTALLMKHYGGFSYAEIGDYMDCPEGTARRRVWTAIRKLRETLSSHPEETLAVKFSHVRGTRLLDFLYGALPADESDKIIKHINECGKCRNEAEEIKRLMGGLDAVEGDFKLTRVIDIDENGAPTSYDWWSVVNTSDQPMKSTHWTVNKDHLVDYVTIQGEEVVMEVRPYSNEQHIYLVNIPHPAKSGEVVDETMVLRNTNRDKWSRQLGNDKWRYTYATSPNTGREWVMSLAIRLPQGAELTKADPEPTDVKTNGTTTVIWKLLPKLHPTAPKGWNSKYQFECTIDYKFKAPSSSAEVSLPTIRVGKDSPEMGTEDSI